MANKLNLNSGQVSVFIIWYLILQGSGGFCILTAGCVANREEYCDKCSFTRPVLPVVWMSHAERRAWGNKTRVLPHVYQRVEFYAVSSHGNVTITAGLPFSHSALKTETASFFKMVAKQVHHNNVTTKNPSTWSSCFWTHTKSQTVDNFTILYEFKRVSLSLCATIHCPLMGLLEIHTA